VEADTYSSEDARLFKINIGYSPTKAAVKLFNDRFPQKTAYYERLNTKHKTTNKSETAHTQTSWPNSSEPALSSNISPTTGLNAEIPTDLSKAYSPEQPNDELPSHSEEIVLADAVDGKMTEEKADHENKSPEQFQDKNELTSAIPSSERIEISSPPEDREIIPPIETSESSKGSSEEDRVKIINEEFISNEFIKSDILEHDLAYQDVELPEQTKIAMLEWSKGSTSASKYAESLEQMSGNESLERLRQLADIIKGEMITAAKKIGLPISVYGKSKSWAMWDLGKQFYYFLHPEQSGVKYEIANPLSSEKKQREIVDRHLGWEAYAAFNSPESVEWRNTISADPKFSKAIEILNKKPKENKTLSSFDLAALGALLRNP